MAQQSASQRWKWKYARADGTRVRTTHDKNEFLSQGDAETWLGESWADLASQGAEYAELFEGRRSSERYPIPQMQARPE